jgi:hypothetical protein
MPSTPHRRHRRRRKRWHLVALALLLAVLVLAATFVAAKEAADADENDDAADDEEEPPKPEDEPLDLSSVIVGPPARAEPPPAAAIKKVAPAAPRPEFCTASTAATERVLRRPATAMAAVALPPLAARPWGGSGNGTSAPPARPPLKLYRNLYYHNKKWFALVDAAEVEEAAAAGFAPPLEADDETETDAADAAAASASADAELLSRRRAQASSPMARLSLLTRNQASLAGVDPAPTHTFSVAPIAAADARAFVDNLPGGGGGGAAKKPGASERLCIVPGLTLLLDHPFPAFPDNLGHWSEVLIPLYSSLRDALEGGEDDALAAAERELAGGEEGSGAASSSPPPLERMVLTGLKRSVLLDWPKNMLALAVSPLTAAPISDSSSNRTTTTTTPQQVAEEKRADAAAAALLPPVLDAAADFEAWAGRGWLVFERALVLQDRYHPRGGLVRERAVAQLVREWRAEQKRWRVGAGRGGASSLLAAQVAERSGPAAIAAATAGAVGYSRPEHAEAMRAAAHRRVMYPWPPRPVPAGAAVVVGAGGSAARAPAPAPAAPPPPPPPPKVVTVLLYPPGHPPVSNHLDLVDLLENVTEPLGMRVRTVSVTPEAPLASHLAAASTTGLLVGRHGPLLASASLFLPPGAAVLELLPYKWDWRDMSRLYVNMTAAARGPSRPLHHWAWRATDAKWCRYSGGEGEALRYGGWTASECTARDCLLAHAKAGLQVDLEAVRALLEKRLPRWLAGQEGGGSGGGGAGDGGGGDAATAAEALVQELAMEAWPPVE